MFGDVDGVVGLEGLFFVGGVFVYELVSVDVEGFIFVVGGGVCEFYMLVVGEVVEIVGVGDGVDKVE